MITTSDVSDSLLVLLSLEMLKPSGISHDLAKFRCDGNFFSHTFDGGFVVVTPIVNGRSLWYTLPLAAQSEYFLMSMVSGVHVFLCLPMNVLAVSASTFLMMNCGLTQLHTFRLNFCTLYFLASFEWTNSNVESVWIWWIW